MIVPWLDNKTERAIGKGFNAKEIHRSKERRPIFSLNVAEERSGSSTPVYASSFPLSVSLSFSPPFSFSLCLSFSFSVSLFRMPDVAYA